MRSRRFWWIVSATVLATVVTVAYFAMAYASPCSKPHVAGSGPLAVQLPFRTITLVRHGTSVGAFVLRRRISRYGFLNGVSYAYWYQSDGSGCLTNGNVITGTGVVYERYDRRASPNGGFELVDLGSKLYIEVGPLKLRWSLDNYIYPPVSYGASQSVTPTEIALTTERDINRVDTGSAALSWIRENE